MTKRTLEETQNLIIGSVVLAGIVAVVGGIVWAAAGLTGLLWILGIGGFIVISSLAVNIPEYRRQKALATRTRIAELEAAAGLAVVQYAGKCHTCKAQLVVGAKYCTVCGAVAENTLRICPSCAAVNPEGAHFCYECHHDFRGEITTAAQSV